MDFIEEYRQTVMNDLLIRKSFTTPWPLWKNEITNYSQTNPSQLTQFARNVGENLRNIVFTTNKGRAGDGSISSGQGTVSAIGT